MRSRASSPPPTHIQPAVVQKKPSILDNLDEDSFSSESNASKQRVTSLKPAAATATATLTSKKPTTATDISAGDGIQAFEEIDDSSFDF